MSGLPGGYIVYLKHDIHVEANAWLISQGIEYMSFNHGETFWPTGDQRIGFCFVDENDSLMFALRWA